MPRISLQLGTGSYESATKPFAAQRCINMYTGAAQAQALNDLALFGTPGVVSFGNVGASPSRGAHVMNGVFYEISGATLFEVDSFGVKTSRGTITGNARVSMADNGDKLCIVVPGGNAYQYIASTTTLTQITDPDYTTSDTVSFKDGYYIFTATSGDTWFVSALNDPTSIDALDFGSAELSPDKIIASHPSHDEIFILGETTTEIFSNVGGSGFPFQRIPGASYEKGTHSKYSPIQWEGSFYFIGGGINEKTGVFQAGGSGEPLRISTDAIEQEIQKFTSTEIGQSFSFSYSIEGFSFVGFTFRSVNIDSKTFVYNLTASRLLSRHIWHEQQTGVADGAWRAESVNFVYDKLLISDNIDGRIGYLDAETYTEYGNTIIREKTTGPFSGKGDPMFVSELELTVDSGQGLITGQGSDPQIMMSYSDDGARTFSSEFSRSMGKIGKYVRRVVWRRLGRIPAYRVWRFRVSDPVKVSFIKLEGDVNG